MQLTQDENNAQYQIQAVSEAGITINKKTYSESLIISPNRLITQWGPKSYEDLTDAYLLQLIETQPEIILLGTGSASKILSDEKMAVLLKKQYQLECMSTPAACRTYTILSAENRHVVAGLIL